MLLSVYIVLGVIGGGLILLSAMGAIGHEVGGDASFDVDHNIDFDHDVDATGEVHTGTDLDRAHDIAHSSDVWLPFLSLRFWIYASASFGLIGILATLFSDAKEPGIVLSASASGLVMGFIAAWAYRMLSRTDLHSGIGEHDMLGAIGKVMVPIEQGKTGKVRLTIKGDTIDMLALSVDDRLEVGEEILVTGVEKDRALVARTKGYLDD